MCILLLVPLDRRNPLPFGMSTLGFYMSRPEYDVIMDDLGEELLPQKDNEELQLALSGLTLATRANVFLPERTIPLLANYYVTSAVYASKNELRSAADELRCAQELTKLALELRLMP